MLLIADDHADTREVLVRLLKRDGYETVAVGSGTEAIEFLQKHRPSLVILDHSMPGMNGLDVLAQMKRDPRLADVPVIMFSATEGPLREQALAIGASAFVLKASLDWSILREQIIQLAGPGERRNDPIDPQAQPRRRKRIG